MLAKTIKHLRRASGDSINGFKAIAKNEFAFQIELVLTFFVIPLSIYLAKSKEALALILASWFLILIVEILNTAIESTVDRIGLERHELSGRAKDLGSTAVFLACANFIMVCLLVLL